MRKILKQLDDTKRYTFTGEYAGVGFKNSYGHFMPTIVLTNVRYQGKIVTDHLWFAYGKQMTDLGMLKVGDQLAFTGRVKPYQKGRYPNIQTDYKINNPRSLKLIDDGLITFRPPMPTIPDEKNALIGYIMKVNKQFYLSHGRPYETWYVNKYENWRKTKSKQVNVNTNN